MELDLKKINLEVIGNELKDYADILLKGKAIFTLENGKVVKAMRAFFNSNQASFEDQKQV